MIADLLRELSQGLVQPYIHRLKARAILAATTIALMSLFGISAFAFAIVIVFIGLSSAFNPVDAALILFAFSAAMCLGTLVVFKLASGLEERRFDERFSLQERSREKVRSWRRDERIDDIKDQVRDTIARNKFGGLAAVAVAGLLIGSRPRWALGLARFALGRTLKQRPRDRYRD
jgi:hypothetical protein